MDNKIYAVNGALPTLYQYRTTFSQASEFLTNVLNGTTTGYALNNFLQNDSDYIVGVMYIPIKTDSFIHGEITTTNMIIGSQISTISSNVKQIVTYKNYISLCSFTLTRHFNNFLDFNPYTQIYLYIPYFSAINLPLEKCYGNTVNVYLSLDFSNGHSTLYIYVGTQLIATRTAQIGILVPLGKTNAQEQERNKTLHGIDAVLGFSVLGGQLANNGGNPLSAIGLTGGVIKNALQDKVQHLTSYSGGSGNHDMLAVDKTSMLIYERPQNVTYPSLSLKGGVCKKNLSLSTVTGYTEIGEIHFNPNGEEIYDDELEELTGLLRDGVIL